jgi:hypothetical protein
MTAPYERLRDIVNTWQLKRTELVETQPQDEDGRAAWLREFAAIHNTMTRQLVRELREESPEFWTALRELAGNAHRVMRGDTIWDQVKFWIRDWRDSFGHQGASETWGDELRQIRDNMTREDEQQQQQRPPQRRRRFWRDGLSNKSAQA